MVNKSSKTIESVRTMEKPRKSTLKFISQFARAYEVLGTKSMPGLIVN